MDRKVERTALIDGDFIAYQTAAWAVAAQADLLAVTERMQAQLGDWAERAFCTKSIVALSCSRDDNFRRGVYPFYKNNRTTEPPPFLDAAKDIIRDNYTCVTRPHLEADDVIGIMATNGKIENPVVVAVDKDMRQIPGLYFNPDKMDFPERITVGEANHTFLMQWLCGDTTDGFKGMFRVGPKKAEGMIPPPCMLETDVGGALEGEKAVFEAYADHPKGYDLEYVLQMRACARILRAEDWDGKKPLVVTEDNLDEQLRQLWINAEGEKSHAA
jgi:hypothetical protein